MRATSIVYQDVEVEDADASGFVVRIGNTRTFVARHVPTEGTTVRRAGDRGRLTLPRWFAERQGLPLSRHEQWQPTGTEFERGTEMAKKDADRAVVQIATRVPMALLQRVKIHCVDREKTIMEFVADALREKLRRVVVLAMSLAELLLAT